MENQELEAKERNIQLVSLTKVKITHGPIKAQANFYGHFLLIPELKT